MPSRIFSVTGTFTAATVASIKVTAWSRSRISAEPNSPLVTCRAGQPMLMSITSAPSPAAIRAPSAIQRASQPASCTTWVALPGGSNRSWALRLPAASAAQAVISETTRPAPISAARRRKGASVTPDIGASTTGLASLTLPIAIGDNAGAFTSILHDAYIVGECSFAYSLAKAAHNASAAVQYVNAA